MDHFKGQNCNKCSVIYCHSNLRKTALKCRAVMVSGTRSSATLLSRLSANTAKTYRKVRHAVLISEHKNSCKTALLKREFHQKRRNNLNKEENLRCEKKSCVKILFCLVSLQSLNGANLFYFQNLTIHGTVSFQLY